MSVHHLQHPVVPVPHLVASVVAAKADDSPNPSGEPGNRASCQSQLHAGIDELLQPTPHRFQSYVPLPHVVQKLKRRVEDRPRTGRSILELGDDQTSLFVDGELIDLATSRAWR